jgi:O-antigen ligase
MRRLVYWLSLTFVFMIPWEGVLQLPGVGTAAKITGVLAGLCWIALIFATGRMRRLDPFLALTTVFVLWIGASAWWSTDTLESARHVITWVQSLVLVFVIWDMFRTRDAIFSALQAYILGGYVAIISALLNFQSAQAFYTHFERFSSGDTNPDGFGFLLALGIPAAWYLAGQTRGGRLSALWKLVNFGFIPVAFLGIALSGTRTAAIAAGVGTIFGIASLVRLRPARVVVVILALGIAAYTLTAFVAPLKSFQRLGTTGTELSQGDLNGRLLQWGQGLSSFDDHPLFGVGTNRYRSVNTLGKEAHNSFVSVLVELGLIGLTLFAAILAMAVARALQTRGWDRAFWLTTLSVWAIGSSTLTWEHRKSTWLILSLVVAAGAEARQRARREVPAPSATVHPLRPIRTGRAPVPGIAMVGR